MSQGLSMQFKDPALRQAVHQITYDEVISAVLRIIHKLDLSSSSNLSVKQEVGVALTDFSCLVATLYASA